jgi:2-polyprenyl-6-methoxyphenol hydroxylase-like FAD-dependent oxidoreductase
VGNWFFGRVVLIGDAAHAMTPNMGQGAGMGLEDAAVLVELLTKEGSVSDAIQKYRLRREGRVTWIHNQSRRIGKLAQLENATACALRNKVLRLIPSSVSNRALKKLVSQPF